MRDREREAETQAEGEAGLHAGSLMWDLILGLQDQAQARGSAKPLSHWGCPVLFIFLVLRCITYIS